MDAQDLACLSEVVSSVSPSLVEGQRTPVVGHGE